MMPGAEGVEQELATLERGVVGQDERLAGTVSLTLCDHYVSPLLLQALIPFLSRHPDIEVSVTSYSRSFDLSKRRADIAVRTLAKGALPPEHLIGQRLAPVVACNDVGACLVPSVPSSHQMDWPPAP